MITEQNLDILDIDVMEVETEEPDISTVLPPEALTLTKKDDDGELTVTVNGCLLNGSEIIYLNMAGSREAVRAIWATFISSNRRRGSGMYLSDHTYIHAPDKATLRNLTTVLPSGLYNMVLIHPDATVLTKGDPFFVVIPDGKDYDEKVPPEGFFSVLKSKLRIPLVQGWASWLWSENLPVQIESKYGYRSYWNASTITRLTSKGMAKGYAVYTNQRELQWQTSIQKHFGFKTT